MQRSALTLTMMLASTQVERLRAKVNLDYRHEIKDFHGALLSSRPIKRRTGVKVEGRKSIAEQKPETVELARKLARTAQGWQALAA